MDNEWDLLPSGPPFPVDFVTFPETSGQISSKQVFVVGVDLISWQISLDLQLFDEFFCTSNLFKAPPGLRHVTACRLQSCYVTFVLISNCSFLT